MANSQGGVVVLGVEDKNKIITGIPLDKLDLVETWIRTICNDAITPELNCSIRKLKVFDQFFQLFQRLCIIRTDMPYVVYCFVNISIIDS